jgi:hypothetical protein
MYWWHPAQSVRSLAGEANRNSRAWAHLIWANSHGLHNFGDEFSVLAARELWGQTPRWAPIDKADVVMVGSVMNQYVRTNSRAQVFGSGVRSLPIAPLGPEPDSVSLIRGALSRDALGLPASTPLGDPGLLISRIHPASRSPKKQPLAVPHFSAFNSTEGRTSLRIARSRGYRVSLPNIPVLEMATNIANASVVLTSSLHAMVFAHSYGTPVVLTDFAPRSEPTFKYEDYLTVFPVHAAPQPLHLLLDGSASRLIETLEEQTSVVSTRLSLVSESIHGALSSFR